MDFVKRNYLKIASVMGAAAAIIFPAATYAYTPMTGGLLIPAGTTSTFLGDIGSIFIPTFTATAFQAEMIGLAVVAATIAVAIFLLFLAWRKFRLRH